MNTTLHTFMDIFEKEFEDDGEKIQVQKIEIPIIQRDYAQGRKTDKINRVRHLFLDSLYKAVVEEPITLDFVYGDIDSQGIMTPLDGQQRLTTLFLLHWYAAKSEDVNESDCAFLQKFSYETRYSARAFCQELIKYTPEFEDEISEEIIDQAWFPLEWKKDPTIASMLVMLDEIEEKFQEVDDLWGKLKSGAVSFYFLPVKEMGLTDELYIKMNSRGKPLTQFEHFKAEFERNLRTIDSIQARLVMEKVDKEWTDLLWGYCSEEHTIDEQFLRYFKFICDIICYKKNESPQGRSYEEFFLLREYFSKECEDVVKNIDLFQEYFKCWSDLRETEKPQQFFARIFSNEHQNGKVQVRGEIDLLGDCLGNYVESTGRNRKFPLNKVVLLYAVIVYLLNKNSITEEQFIRRLRIVNNLVRNSEDEVSDSEQRSGGNRMPEILKQVDAVIKKGEIKADGAGFNKIQIEEEIEKSAWLAANADKAEELFELEDHILLFGQIGIVGLEHQECFGKFMQLFHCDLDLVDAALMATGNYMQCERNMWRYQAGTSSNKIHSAWQELFHKSTNEGYENTKAVLYQLLSSLEEISDNALSRVMKEYLRKCEEDRIYEWRYYYVKYKIFRPGSYGKYYWDDFEGKPYVMRVMQTRRNLSENSYQPFLKAVDVNDNISKPDYGEFLIDGDEFIDVEQDSFVIYSLDDGRELRRIYVKQNEAGIDVEDRIKRLEKYMETGR